MKFNHRLNRWEEHFSLTDLASNWKDVFEWCWSTFRHPGTDPESGILNKWDYHGGWIYLYDEKYVTMYILRWG